MDCEAMKKNNIEISFSDYVTAHYLKNSRACMPNMSVLDYIFYWGYDFSILGWNK